MTSPASGSIAIFDLDRVLVRGGSGRVVASVARQSGLVSRELSNGDVFYSLLDAFGDNLVVMALARQLPLLFKGKQRTVLQLGISLITPDLSPWMQEFAKNEIAMHREAGRKIMLATAMPSDIAKPIAAKLGIDLVVATEYATSSDGKFDGGIAGEFVWSEGKTIAVLKYAEANNIDLGSSFAYSDSRYDISLLESVGNPVVVNADGKLKRVASAKHWRQETFDDDSSVNSLIPDRQEAQKIAFKVLRPELMPFAKFDLQGVEIIGAEKPAIIVCELANNFDYASLAFVLSAIGRPVGFSRLGDDADEIVESLNAGEIQVVTGGDWVRVVEAAKSTKADVYALKVSGSELVWPVDKPLPAFWNLRNPPTVTSTVSGPLDLKFRSASADVARIQEAIS